MTEVIIAAVEIYVLFLAVALIIAGGVRLQKFLFFRRTRRFAEQQERQWLSEQQQRRQHQRAVRNSNNY